MEPRSSPTTRARACGSSAWSTFPPTALSSPTRRTRRTPTKMRRTRWWPWRRPRPTAAAGASAWSRATRPKVRKGQKTRRTARTRAPATGPPWTRTARTGQGWQQQQQPPVRGVGPGTRSRPSSPQQQSARRSSGGPAARHFPWRRGCRRRPNGGPSPPPRPPVRTPWTRKTPKKRALPLSPPSRSFQPWRPSRSPCFPHQCPCPRRRPSLPGSPCTTRPPPTLASPSACLSGRGRASAPRPPSPALGRPLPAA
mmetsp:Transcript_11748/g.33918  ORF Transcript_11748/g.33918 Transcript_11748/m.33918 type:complete len:254 (+) Transcript_11748:266-1027(+)